MRWIQYVRWGGGEVKFNEWFWDLKQLMLNGVLLHLGDGVKVTLLKILKYSDLGLLLSWIGFCPVCSSAE